MEKELAKKEDMVPLEEAKEQVRKVCALLGLLHYSYAKTLVDELGEKKGKQLAMNAIKLCFTIEGERTKEGVKAKGLENSVENYYQDLPLYGMHDKVERFYVEGQRKSKAYGCVMAKVWRELGGDKLGRIFCYSDPVKFMAYNPNFKLIHTKTIPDGDEYCDLRVIQTSEHDRENLAAKDSDLKKIDKLSAGTSASSKE